MSREPQAAVTAVVPLMCGAPWEPVHGRQEQNTGCFKSWAPWLPFLACCLKARVSVQCWGGHGIQLQVPKASAATHAGAHRAHRCAAMDAPVTPRRVTFSEGVFASAALAPRILPPDLHENKHHRMCAPPGGCVELTCVLSARCRSRASPGPSQPQAPTPTPQQCTVMTLEGPQLLKVDGGGGCQECSPTEAPAGSAPLWLQRQRPLLWVDNGALLAFPVAVRLRS